MTEHTFRTWDHEPLFYRAWRPEHAGPKAVLLFHRGHEHSGRLGDLAERLRLEDFSLFAWDQRGHGRSPGERGYAADFSTLIRDVDAFVRHVRDTYGIPVENMAIVAYSVGSVLASAWVHDYAPPIRALVLGAPAFRVKLYVPFALPLLRLKQALVKKSFLKSYVRSTMLTHDPDLAKDYDRDPLISRSIAVNVLLGLADTSSRLLADAGAIRVPALTLSAGSDWVVSLPEQQRFHDGLSSPLKAMEVYDRFHHAVFHEKDRERPIARARQFILQAFDQLPRTKAADVTTGEHERLLRPLPLSSPKRAGYAISRVLMKTVGRLSDGIRLGWRTGFDSGQSLDYVYENRARGLGLIGRLIDRAYLNSVGWKGIRQRKVHLELAIEKAIDLLRSRHPIVRIVDVAAGPGRYLLDLLGRRTGVEALLRDRSLGALEDGRRLARERNLTNVRYEEGDAFDPASLVAIDPRPDVAVVSGLYELFPDNGPVRRSLEGLARALPDDGLLVYTNQPWHPQLEFIARVLRNRDGKPWIMRRRPQAEMDDLVRDAGFEKISQAIDEWGIFSVSLARKRSP
ncbi:MAG TPA: bifunctional alpha/beta hydrolase/class I SAM-dependent methyltransferase [Planctomycetota bacterium]|nr:bifunctional alpha/beta hydrolase/class I SAM-dependent methyltransferase [Planctomycetota bacterium]